MVLLNREPPDEEVRHVLKHHPNSHRLFYIQGDPFNHLVSWGRSQYVTGACSMTTPLHTCTQTAGSLLQGGGM